MATIPDVRLLTDEPPTQGLSRLNLDVLRVNSCIRVSTAAGVVSLCVVHPASGLVIYQGVDQELELELPQVAFYLGACIGSTVIEPRTICSGLSMQFITQDGFQVLQTGLVNARGVSRVLQRPKQELLQLAVWSYEAHMKSDSYLPVIIQLVESLPVQFREQASGFLEVFSPAGRVLLTELFRGAHQTGRLSQTLELLYHQCLYHWGNIEKTKRGELRTARDQQMAGLIFHFAGVPFPPELPSGRS